MDNLRLIAIGTLMALFFYLGMVYNNSLMKHKISQAIGDEGYRMSMMIYREIQHER